MDLSSPLTALHSLKRKELLSNNDCDAIEHALSEIGSGAEASQLLNDKIQEFCGLDQWEYIACGLLLSIALLNVSGSDGKGKPVNLAMLIQHQEPRIRNLAAECLGAYASSVGVSAYEQFEDLLLNNIRSHFARESDRQVAVLGESEIAVDDTSGWSNLETSLIALTKLITGCGRALLSLNKFTDEVLDLCINQSSQHINRHIRQACCAFILALLELKDQYTVTEPLIQRCSKILAALLQDNWSQVRFASSIPTRTMVLRIPEQEREALWPLLVPRMCLNRYYVAEGVKLYSQETWRLVFGDKGREVVGRYMREVTEYYAEMVSADNHIVRESACFSIAELATKIDQEIVGDFVPGMLRTMLLCFDDESWPVRDAACVSTGRFVKHNPDQPQELLDSLYSHWFKNICDPIWSVRENAAVAFGDVMDCKTAVADDVMQRVNAFISAHVLDAKQQEPSGPKQRRHSGSAGHEHTHVDQTMYSCGSLAPKLRKGGCSDCHVSRSSYPWEYSDGCVYLIRELAQRNPSMAEQYFPALIELLGLDHYGDANYLHATIWKQIPAIAKALGKRPYKRYLPDLIDKMYRHLSASSTRDDQCYIAAMDCLAATKQFVGENIFASKVPEEYRSILC